MINQNKRDQLPLSWKEKFKLYNTGVNYLYSYTNEEQLNNAIQAVEEANLEGKFTLDMHISKTKFTIARRPVT